MQSAGLVLPRNLDNEAVIGLSGVVIVVHPDNPLRALSLAQLRDLLSSANTRWSNVGGGNQTMTVHGLDRNAGAHEYLVEALAADPIGIGFVDAACVRNVRALQLELECGLGGDPSGFFMKTEEYPLASRLSRYPSAMWKRRRIAWVVGLAVVVTASAGRSADDARTVNEQHIAVARELGLTIGLAYGCHNRDRLWTDGLNLKI